MVSIYPKKSLPFVHVPLLWVMVVAFACQTICIVGLASYIKNIWNIWNVLDDQRETICLCLISLILSSGWGWLITRWLGKSILRLNIAIESIAAGLSPPPIFGNNEIAEIVQLARSLELVKTALQESQAKYQLLFETIPVGISITDRHAHVIENNQISEIWFGKPHIVQDGCIEQQESNPNIIRIDGSPMPVSEYACVKALRTHSPVHCVETGIVCIDGKLRWFSVSAAPITLEQYGVVLVHVDISDRKYAEEALKNSEARLKAFLDNAPTPIAIKDLEGKYLEVNQEFEYWMQHSRAEIIGCYDYDFFAPDKVKNVRKQELQTIFEGLPVNFEDTALLRGDDQTFAITKFPLSNEKGLTYAVAGIYLNITDRKKVELALLETEINLRSANQELARLVNLDGLTQIANRRCFNDHLIQEWQRLIREGNPLSLLMFDVDFFKQYNDHYGHQLGDECLIKIAQAVKNTLSRPADMVARYGGEEFIVILPNTPLEGAIAIAEKIHAAIHNLQIPHHYSLTSNVVSVSLGIACDFPDLDRSPQYLVNLADQALYQAKQQGRNCSVTASLGYA